MTIRAVFFDMGGVIVRTEFEAPRQHLAERLNMEYDDLVRLVFYSPSARQASLGQMSTEQHWAAVVHRLGLPPSEARVVRAEFFAGDFIDRDLVNFIRTLRPRYHTGVISNAWPDTRAYLEEQQVADAFDQLVVSAEVGVMKPEARIYQIALERAGVQAGEAVLLDDFAENLEGARAVGMRAVHFHEPKTALAQLRELLNHP